ncbi:MULTISPECIES: ester cyclase [unclassified Campylobacter]|uniref:ester cyclase n=1 Tax=unclassified Campylobacter TaxID=2593542 RepID=UPI0022E9A37D|nr:MULTISPECIES: ester cyclase [unclassified Campylobacter]MDA3062698.1 ester cyclase [Campylobacter sp. JMF_14 EL1]MDA3074001.1 ester cyclase [Campylobacter sp. JMF_10 EL2]
MKKFAIFAVLVGQILCANSNLAQSLEPNFNQICYQSRAKSECNKEAMAHFQTAINTADTALAEKLINQNATFFTPVSKDPLYGGAGYISVVNFMRQSFPDIKWQIKDIVANDAVVAVLWECSGTHERGEFYGKKADKAKFSFSTMNFYYFDENGKITNDVAGEGLAGLLIDLEILK